MQLLRFKVQHYKCLYDTDWIPFRDLTVFTGENDGGKSSTLQALGIFLNSRSEPGEEDYSYKPDFQPDLVEAATGTGNSHPHESTCRMWGEFQLSSSEQLLLKELMRIDSDTLCLERAFGEETDPASYFFTAKVHRDERLREPVNSLSINKLRQIASDFEIPISGTAKAPIVAAIQQWLDEQPQEEFIDGQMQLPRELVNCLPLLEVFSGDSADDPEKIVESMLKTHFVQLVRGNQYENSLAEFTEKIYSELNAEIDSLRPFIRRYAEDVDDIAIEPKFDFSKGLSTTRLQLIRSGRGPVHLKQSGSGQRRRITLGIYEARLEGLQEDEDVESKASETRQDLIMAFDEPDTHLDYRWQRKIFDLIERFSRLKSVQVVASSHSLNFIERVPIDQIVHFRLNTQRYTECETLSTLGADDSDEAGREHRLRDLFLYRISENMGLRNSILLHERCFLIVEGPTEVNALPVLFYLKYQRSLQAAGICLLDGEGFAGAIQLVEFLSRNKRNVLFLLDNDVRLGPSSKKHFTQPKLQSKGIDPSLIHFVGEREFEDAFSNEQWATVANRYYKRVDEKAWKPEDIEAVRSETKFSSKLASCLQQHSHRLVTKPDLGYLLGQSLRVSEAIPESISHCFEEAYRIANPETDV